MKNTNRQAFRINSRGLMTAQMIFAKQTFLLIPLALMLLTGCASNFATVPFRYGNLSQMRVDECFKEVETEPEKLVFALSDFFRERNYVIVDRAPLDFHYAMHSNSINVSEAYMEVAQKEFEVYQKNDFAMFKNLDRAGILKKHHVLDGEELVKKVTNTGTNKTWFISVDIPQGDRSVSYNVPQLNTSLITGINGALYSGIGTSYSTETTTLKFESRLKIWAWHDPEKCKTVVYMEALPKSGQVVAGPNSSIGFDWWRQANGYAESLLVKNYFLLIDEMKRSGKIAIREQEAARTDDSSALPVSAPSFPVQPTVPISIPTVPTSIQAPSRPAQSATCSYCGGTGRNPTDNMSGTVNTWGHDDLGVDFCKICNRTVKKPHIHGVCPVCYGTGKAR